MAERAPHTVLWGRTAQILLIAVPVTLVCGYMCLITVLTSVPSLVECARVLENLEGPALESRSQGCQALFDGAFMVLPPMVLTLLGIAWI